MPKKMKNSKKKQAYKNTNNKNTRIYLVIGILVLLLLQFIALGLSRAQRLIEIEVTVKDSENLVADQNIILNAIDSGDSGHFILLPEKVNSVYTIGYHVENTEILESNPDDEETDDEEPSGYYVLNAGDKIFLNEEELTNREVEIVVEYNSKVSQDDTFNEKVYYRDLYENEYVESEDILGNILLKAYMPLNLELEIGNQIPLEVD